MRGLGKAAKVMFLINLAFSLGMGLYMFIMAAYARQLGATPAQFGAILSAANVIGVLAVIPGGVWADRFDARKLMIISWAMCLPVPLIYAWAQTWQWLIPGYALIFASFFANPAINVYITSSVSHERLGSTWGVINSAFPLGTIIGPAAGALIIRGSGMPALFLCTFFFYVLSFLLLFALPPVGGPGAGRPETSPAPPATPTEAAAIDGQSPGEDAQAPRDDGPSGSDAVARPVARAMTPAAAAAAVRRGTVQAILPVFLVFAIFTALVNTANYVSLYLQDTQGLDIGSLRLVRLRRLDWRVHLRSPHRSATRPARRQCRDARHIAACGGSVQRHARPPQPGLSVRRADAARR